MRKALEDQFSDAYERTDKIFLKHITPIKDEIHNLLR